jgi:hypothetical protein
VWHGPGEHGKKAFPILAAQWTKARHLKSGESIDFDLQI